MVRQKRRTILVVDDDAAIVRGMKTLLEAEGLDVSISTDGPAAVAKALRTHPDVVLLDLGLPGLNGFEVCRQLRDGGLSGRIIMVSAQREGADKILGLEAGADDYVTKPFDARELIARVRAHLRSADRPTRRAGATAPGMEERELVAILFADMKGYSRVMHRSESAALRGLRLCRSVLRREIKRGRGKVVEIVGDAVFATFESAVAAVQTSVRAQAALRRSSCGTRTPAAVPVRIGIHLGDVIRFEGVPKGDAVNIAARLQELARPGGILVSGAVRDATKGKLTVRLASRGTRKLKNIEDPVQIFAVITTPHGNQP